MKTLAINTRALMLLFIAGCVTSPVKNKDQTGLDSAVRDRAACEDHILTLRKKHASSRSSVDLSEAERLYSVARRDVNTWLENLQRTLLTAPISATAADYQTAKGNSVDMFLTYKSDQVKGPLDELLAGWAVNMIEKLREINEQKSKEARQQLAAYINTNMMWARFEDIPKTK